jgi:hypothetical protein
MWPAFPSSDYYGPYVPPRRYEPATGLPADQLAAGRGGDRRGGSHVHHGPLDGGNVQLCPCGFATSTPQAFDVASLPTTLIGSGCAPRPSPDPPGSSWWYSLERRSAVGFYSYTFPSCLPDPDHLTVLARPVVVGAAVRPLSRP